MLLHFRELLTDLGHLLISLCEFILILLILLASFELLDGKLVLSSLIREICAHFALLFLELVNLGEGVAVGDEWRDSYKFLELKVLDEVLAVLINALYDEL